MTAEICPESPFKRKCSPQCQTDSWTVNNAPEMHYWLFRDFPRNAERAFLAVFTWSYYKHHHKGKFLIGCAPKSAITYVSRVILRVSNKALTSHCNFLDLMDQHDVLMADKAFMVQSVCERRLINLYIPPGLRGQAQMSSAAVQKTERSASRQSGVWSCFAFWAARSIWARSSMWTWSLLFAPLSPTFENKFMTNDMAFEVSLHSKPRDQFELDSSVDNDSYSLKTMKWATIVFIIIFVRVNC